ncbi:MAG: hypothetical protein JW849_09935 [Phycisphaerae bacterium]|nr:hypothetical protein [Phycisphaerae bacterium]
MRTKHYVAPGMYGFLLIVFFVFGGCDESKSVSLPSSAETNQSLRDASIHFLRGQLAPSGAASSEAVPENLSLSGGWAAEVKFYAQGQLQGEGTGSRDVLAEALCAALKAWKTNTAVDWHDAQTMRRGRFFVTLHATGQSPFSFVEYEGGGKEIVGDLVATYTVDTNLLREKILAGRDYLLRIINKDRHAFFKRFDAATGIPDARLRTIYTASCLYTLLKMYDLTHDPAIREQIPPITRFLLSMQNTSPEHRGAFHYSCNEKTGEKENTFVVGTASKTIFALLELYQRTRNPADLSSARSAGDWLLSMQRPNGTIVNRVRRVNGVWKSKELFSTLYAGQVVSALSRLYGVTNDVRYLQGAEKTVGILLRRAETTHYFLQDDYRHPTDPIPTTWAVQSLLDFYKVSKRQDVKIACLRCARAVLARQHTDPSDVENYGRFKGTRATSGNGWILEVFMELYRYARGAGWENCEPYKTAAVCVARWLIQNTYSPENTYFLEHGPEVMGGLIRSNREESVRTDAVCHGSNGYMLLLMCTKPGVLLSIPETVSYP